MRRKIRRQTPRKNPAAHQKKSAKNLFCKKPSLRRGFSNSWTCCVFFARKSVIAREYSPEFDTSPTIATSVLEDCSAIARTPFLEHPHSNFPNRGLSGWRARNAEKSRKCLPGLRGPTAILFTARDTCSDNIAILFRACFCRLSHNYRAICCKMGYCTDAPLKSIARYGVSQR